MLVFGLLLNEVFNYRVVKSCWNNLELSTYGAVLEKKKKIRFLKKKKTFFLEKSRIKTFN